MRKSKYFLLGFLSAAMIVVVNVIAAGLPVANIFVSGETAVAADVNANFQELADRIDAADMTYDYRNYGAAETVTQKVFSVEGLGAFDLETRNLIITTNSKNIVRIRTIGGASSKYHIIDESKTATALIRDAVEVYDATGVTLISTNTIDDDIPLLTSSMKTGETWGGAATVTDNPDAATTITAYATSTLLAIEDVTVPTGAYVDCLKVLSVRMSSGGTLGNSRRMSWHCANVGRVKTIRMGHDGLSPVVWELTSVTM